jgi:hypothetical protein
MPVTMPTIQHEHEISFNELSDKITAHVERHKVAYSFGAGIFVAGIISYMMRGTPCLIRIDLQSPSSELLSYRFL